MNESAAPIPANEMGRLLNLSDYNIDYESLENNFKDLAKLAARLTGTEISLVNLIDSYTQWTVSYHGLEIDQMPREESVCQYTIMEEDYFEVTDLAGDDRFKNKFYVVDDPEVRYYYGVPLKSDGYKIGALCVLDRKPKAMAPEKTELLHIIGEEVVNRLKAYKAIEGLKSRVKEADQTKKKVAHDIRGPLAGIIGLSEIIKEKGNENELDEVLQFIRMIHQSSKSLLDLADEILSIEKKPAANGALQSHELNLNMFKQKLEKLYLPQAKVKKIEFSVSVTPETAETAFSKNKLLQIAGNLISNAIKFTPAAGHVTVKLSLAEAGGKKQLTIIVADSGVGLTPEKINEILDGSAQTTDGTGGEKGYGFGLALVKHLITTQQGTFNIHSKPGQGAEFVVVLPV